MKSFWMNCGNAFQISLCLENCMTNRASYIGAQRECYRTCLLYTSQWDFLKEDLQKFFDKTDGTAWIAVGTVGRWDGTRAAGVIFDEFNDFFYRATKDCDYWSFYDINGHLYLECSHHDGDNQFEIRRITKTGMRYYRNWECNWNDKRSKQYIHQKIMEKYSVLPHFAHTIFAYPKQEFIKIA